MLHTAGEVASVARLAKDRDCLQMNGFAQGANELKPPYSKLGTWLQPTLSTSGVPNLCPLRGPFFTFEKCCLLRWPILKYTTSLTLSNLGNNF